MGELTIRRARDEAEARAFSRAVVRDIHALELLIEKGGIETGIARMGVEQEMYLVGSDLRPMPRAQEILAGIDDPRFTYELASFNLEANFLPQVLRGGFLGELERQLTEALALVNGVAAGHDASVLLTGILPTLGNEHMRRSMITPLPRYEMLNEALMHGRDAITVVIGGIDQYEGRHDSVVLEGANTSLQLHLQVTPDNAADRYNLMQLITAPLLAAATNSPVLLGRRLWHETRVAVFERSLDERTDAQLSRGFPTRVCFGQNWLRHSLLEIFHDNAARFPSILGREITEDSVAMVEAGDAPKLAALALHNGTVWRWNRPCYGVADGVAHLRIENRVLPSGPTIIDEVANAALFYGLMQALPERYGDVAAQLPFADAKSNFLGAARQGLGARFAWLGGRRVEARELLLRELIPAARDGLAALQVPDDQIDRYLGVIEARVGTGQTGADWLLDSFQAHRDAPPQDIWRGAVAAMLDGLQHNRPVHEWLPAEPLPSLGRRMPPVLGDVMTTDLFTLRPDDVVDLASGVMKWKRIRHVPVEDAAGRLVGVLTARELLAIAEAAGNPPVAAQAPAVASLMHTSFTTAPPHMSVREAVPLMLASDLGALLIVNEGGTLMGIVTERDMVRLLADLLGMAPPQPRADVACAS